MDTAQITQQLKSPLIEIQPSTSINLQWKGLSVEVADPSTQGRKMKTILSNCSGYASAGQTLAIMGPSGAGKTTLMGVLTKRINERRGTKVSGEILMNGKSYTSLDFSRSAAYILQEDILMEMLTVRGGTFSKGISGGEKKRTNIGVELVTDPGFIVLDEPTSGLDSFTALVIISLLKKMAKQEGKTVIFTIHQPSSEIYNALDRILLVRSGETVYQGKAQDVMKYISNQGSKLPEYFNPADFFMELLSQKPTSKGQSSQPSVFSISAYDQQIRPAIEAEMGSFIEVKRDQQQVVSANSFFYEIKQISKRSLKNFYRSPMLLRAKIVQILLMSFLIGSLWWKIGNDQPDVDSPDINSITSWVMNLAGLLFFYGVSIFMNIMLTLVITFPGERGVFLKEQSSNSYRVSSYFVGKIVTEIPYIILYPLLQNSVIYWILDLRSDGFGISTLIFIITSFCGNGLGFITGSLFGNVPTAMALTPMLLLPFMMFGGFFSNLNALPSWMSWVQYISPFRYMLNGLLMNQFDGLMFGEYDPVSTFGYSMTAWEAIFVLIGIMVLFHLVAFIFLKTQARKIG